MTRFLLSAVLLCCLASSAWADPRYTDSDGDRQRNAASAIERTTTEAEREAAYGIATSRTKQRHFRFPAAPKLDVHRLVYHRGFWR